MQTAGRCGPVLDQYQVKSGRLVPEWIENEAHLLNDALNKGVIDRDHAEHGLTTDTEIHGLMQSMVDLTYFVEFPPESVSPKERGGKILKLFNSPIAPGNKRTGILADYMANRHQGVSLAMSTLDKPTADAIRFLNDREVPVNGWVVLEDEDGYWTNRTSIDKTAKRAMVIRDWADQHNIKLAGLGIDIEMPMSYIKAMANRDTKARRKAKQNYNQRVLRAEAAYGGAEEQLESVIRTLGDIGLKTEVYTMPRFSKKGLLGLAGMDINPSTPDRYIEMVYTTDLPGPLKSLAPKGRAARLLRNKHAIPAFGIVSGDGTTPGRQLSENGDIGSHLSQQELADNMRAVLSHETSVRKRELKLRDIYIFALNDPRVAYMATSALGQAFKALG